MTESGRSDGSVNFQRLSKRLGIVAVIVHSAVMFAE